MTPSQVPGLGLFANSGLLSGVLAAMDSAPGLVPV